MYKDLIVIDGLQYCRWDRDYFLFLKSSGITAVHVTLVYHEVARDVLSILAKWNNFFESNSDLIMPVMSTDDIILAKRQNKVGILFGAQNCSLLDDEIGLVEIMRKLGLMIMQLTYNNQSLLATGCYEKEDGGITRFGAQVISEMNRVGMIIDMSHSADKSTLQAIDLSSRPICISHANPRSAHAGLRNKSDEIIKALISRGGLLGFSLYPFHLPGSSNCTLRRFCEMIADTTEKFGTEHFAIGVTCALINPNPYLNGCVLEDGPDKWNTVKDRQAMRAGLNPCPGSIMTRGWKIFTTV